MRFTPRKGDPLFDSINPVVQGLGMALVDISVSRHRRSVQIRAVICKPGTVGVDDCSQVHRALLPRLELAFPDHDLSVEVSSPGIDRIIKDGSELVHYIGRGIKCFRTDISDWSSGILQEADETHLVLKGKDGMIDLGYERIAKAKLDYLREV
ncbi:MAG: ribosome assembly cofactor RimP [Treponema sp.]|jgi:ribosome maturation factor RimP|nr:ribosome assembly cofactor RimP [Treponema sp.]